jgi:phytoene dehydrogenase-like protein
MVLPSRYSSVISPGSCKLMLPKYDAIIIGAGHNGLVTAAYLARARRKVLVLERRELIGGCVVTEELWPGFKVSTASYVNSLFRPEIIRDLELKRHGFVMLPRSPSSFTPLPDGRYLLMGPDKEMTHREVSKFSEKDAHNLPRFEAMLERVASFLEPMLVETPTPFGLVRHVRLPGRTSGVRPDWASSPAPPGTHPPAFIDA